MKISLIFFILFLAQTIAAPNNYAILRGSVSIPSLCYKSDAMLWISLKSEPQKILYHLHLRPEGSFFFQLLPQEYIIRISTDNVENTKCRLEQNFSLTPQEEKKLSLVMKL